jgi:hypothetical protein
VTFSIFPVIGKIKGSGAPSFAFFAKATRQSNQVNVFAKPAAIQQVLKEGIRYQQQIAAPAKGEYYLRMGVHDLIGDKVGAMEIPVASVATMAAGPGSQR